MKNFLTICDLYGGHFHWYIGFKSKNYTYYGGFFSILSLIGIIFIFAFLGYNDFKRNNPNSNTSTVPPTGYKKIKFGKEKLYLPWRIIDYDENAINISGLIYPKIFYFTVQPDNITGELITKFNFVNYKLCNETSMKNLGEEYIIDIPIDTLYCIDMEDLNVGGSWNSDFLNFIRFDLYMCQDGINYNMSDSKCTNYDDLKKIYGKGDSIFFELLYPVIQFQPTNLKVPILILYKTYYYILNKLTNKLDRMYLQEYIFEDEQSWIFDNPKNVSYWGVSSINGESYITEDKDVLRFAGNSKLYTLNMYFELGIIFYTRKYKKLYEILGEIFPIMSAICSFFSFLSGIFSDLKTAKSLNEYITGYENDKYPIKFINKNKSTKQLKINRDISFNNNNSIKNNQITNSINIFRNKDFNLRGKPGKYSNRKLYISKNLDESSNIFCNQNNISININSYRKKISRKNNDPIVDKSEQKNKPKNKKEKYPLHYYFFGYIYSRVSKKKNNGKHFLCITEKFYKSFTYFRHFIDISSYIVLQKEFETFKKLINSKLNINEIDSVNNRLNNNKSNVLFHIESNNNIYKKNKYFGKINL